MDRKSRLIAAQTARMLGYKTIRVLSRAYPATGYIAVYSPNGDKVCYWWVPSMGDNEALGHFLVRLHMEEHYGIKTEHYWEESCHLK